MAQRMETITGASKVVDVWLLALLLSVGQVTQVSTMKDPDLRSPTTLSWVKKPMNKGNVALTYFPNPQTNPDGCGRQNQSFVCDPDQVLSADEANQIDEEIRMTCLQTTCSCSPSCRQSCPGYGISVAITASLPREEQGGQISDTQMTRWVESLRTSGWKFGSCGDDTIIVLSTQHTKVFTSSGEMANQILSPDLCVQKITQIIQPHLRDGHFGRALLEMIRHYRLSFQLGYCSIGKRPQIAALRAEDDDNIANNKSDITPPPAQDSPEESSDSGLSGAQIAGIVIGAVVGAAMILGLVLYCCGFGDSDPESNAPYVKPSKQGKQANRRNVRYKPQRGHHSGGGGWTGYDTGTTAGYVAAAVVIGGASDWGHDDDRGGGGGGGGGDWGGDDGGGGVDFGD